MSGRDAEVRALTEEERLDVLAYCREDIPEDVWRDALAYVERVRDRCAAERAS